MPLLIVTNTLLFLSVNPKDYPDYNSCGRTAKRKQEQAVVLVCIQPQFHKRSIGNRDLTRLFHTCIG